MYDFSYWKRRASHYWAHLVLQTLSSWWDSFSFKNWALDLKSGLDHKTSQRISDFCYFRVLLSPLVSKNPVLLHKASSSIMSNLENRVTTDFSTHCLCIIFSNKFNLNFTFLLPLYFCENTKVLLSEQNFDYMMQHYQLQSQNIRPSGIIPIITESLHPFISFSLLASPPRQSKQTLFYPVSMS